MGQDMSMGGREIVRSHIDKAFARINYTLATGADILRWYAENPGRIELMLVGESGMIYDNDTAPEPIVASASWHYPIPGVMEIIHATGPRCALAPLEEQLEFFMWEREIRYVTWAGTTPRPGSGRMH